MLRRCNKKMIKQVLPFPDQLDLNPETDLLIRLIYILAPSPGKPTVNASKRNVAAAATADDVSTAAISEHLQSSAMDETLQKEVVTGDASRKGMKSSTGGPTSGKTGIIVFFSHVTFIK